MLAIANVQKDVDLIDLIRISIFQRVFGCENRLRYKRERNEPRKVWITVSLPHSCRLLAAPPAVHQGQK